MNGIKHMLWLIKQLIVACFKCNLADIEECVALIRLHWNCKSKKIK